MVNYRNQWQQKATALQGLATFPILISKEGDKWQKKPLVKGWQHTKPGHRWADYQWKQANGYGILIRDGIVMIDVDPYKEGAEASAQEWFKKHSMPKTRTHKTISGGWHFFFRVPAKIGDVRTRTNVVKNVDIRGGLAASGEDRPTSRGFAAFGEGYTLARDIPMALLPVSAAEAINAGASGGSVIVTDADLANYIRPADLEDVHKRLDYWREWNVKLDYRFKGMANGIDRSDRSRSQIDISVAGILTRLGFDFHEIVYILMDVLETGRARHEQGKSVGGTDKGLRLAQRAATAAEKSREAEAMENLTDVIEEPTHEPADIAIVMAQLTGGE